MRDFQDETGTIWTATVEEARGPDYKGRYHLVMTNGESKVELIDVRWNSPRTAERTLETMSVAELRRRLRSARGRSAGV